MVSLVCFSLRQAHKRVERLGDRLIEVEKLVEPGEIDPDNVHTPGIFVHRIVVNPNPEKRIEQRTVRAQ